MPWYKVSMAAGQAAKGEHVQLQDKFQNLWTDAGAPEDMALLSGGWSQDEFNVYFTPGCVSDATPYPRAKSLIEAYGAVPCDEPTHEKILGLLVGDQATWEHLLRHPNL